jgi:RNA polymerase sigma-70 factor (sigma-E family)
VEDSAQREFAGFVAARSGALIRVAYLLAGDQNAAEDLLQTALTKEAARWSRIHTAPEAYVRQVMYREQVSWWRRRARHRETTMAELPDRPAAVPDISAETQLSVRLAVRALPPGKRAVLVLRYFEDLPEAQVASILVCSVGTVRSQTHKALVQLRSALAAPTDCWADGPRLPSPRRAWARRVPSSGPGPCWTRLWSPTCRGNGTATKEQPATASARMGMRVPAGRPPAEP